MTAQNGAGPGAPRRLPLPEFTAMLAMLFATVSFSMDSMLPSLSAIAVELTPDAVNRAQLIVPIFMAGLGIGTLFAGPISDAVGRKPTIAGGISLYVAGALLAYFANSLEALLIARFIQGLGAAGPRIAGIALARDLFAGSDMARVMSFVMMVFMIVPAVAPAIGAAIVAVTGWRTLFLAFILFGLTALTWLSVRQGETLPADLRRPLSPAILGAGLREVLANREVRAYTLVMSFGFGQMMALLSSIQPIFTETFGRAREFPLWFAMIAGFSAATSFFNSRLVLRLGMRNMAAVVFGAQALLSLVMTGLFMGQIAAGALAFPLFFLWAASIFCMMALTFGNLNALAMQTMGHLAGMASSVISAVSTILAVAIAAPVGQLFDGTPRPVMLSAAICSCLAWALLRATREKSI